MKTIYVSFDYLYVILKAETDIPCNIYSSKADEDLIFFVMNENATESDFHDADEVFTHKHTKYQYQKSSEYVQSQSKYGDVHDKLEQLNDEFIDILFDADFALKFKEYQL